MIVIRSLGNVKGVFIHCKVIVGLYSRNRSQPCLIVISYYLQFQLKWSSWHIYKMASIPWIITSTILLLGVSHVQGYSSGAPSAQCTGMTPGHGTPQGGSAPYQITVDKSTLTAGSTIQGKTSTVEHVTWMSNLLGLSRETF